MNVVSRLVCRLVAVSCLLAAGAAVAAPSTLDRIRSTGTIRMGWHEDGAPFSYAGADGRPQGFSVDLCERVARAIAQRLGRAHLDIEWRRTDLATRFEQVKRGELDVECGTSTRTLGRAEEVDFSLTIFVDGATVLVPNGSDAFRLDDLAQRRIAVIAGSTNQTALRAATAERGLAWTEVVVADPDTAWSMLARGEIDGFAWDRVKLLGLALAGAGSGTWRLIEDDFSMERYALVMPRDDGPLRREVDRALAGVFRSGDIGAVYDRWMGALGRPGVLLNAIWYLGRLPE
jgi:ABC-type amino acid transport substrate-binding protein